MVGSSDPVWIAEELLLDSLVFLRVIPANVGNLVDIGSGAGLPGIPIKIVKPEARMLLVESRQRRASFLKTVVRELDLRDIEVVPGRVLTVPAGWRNVFDAAVARCAGNLDTTMRLGVGFVRTGGSVVLSGPPTPGPVNIGSHTVVHLPGGKTRNFVVHIP